MTSATVGVVVCGFAANPASTESTYQPACSPMASASTLTASSRDTVTNGTSRPSASPSCRASSTRVSTSGPRRDRVRPAWASSSSAAAATAAMSSIATGALAAAGNGSWTAPVARICGAHSRTFSMKSAGHRCVHAIPLASTARVTLPHQPPGSPERSTTCRTPARAARTSTSSTVSGAGAR